MLPSFIVAFREILEVALITGIVLAATRGVEGRKRWVLFGIALGIAGSAVTAMFTESIAELAEGMGQELFNACILFTASLIIGWTAIWMKTHAKEMVTKIRSKGQQVVDGSLPKYTIAAIIALAALREGAEIVLFTYGMLASGQPPLTITTGISVGVLAGGTIGALLYLGLVSIPTKHVFQVTTWLLLLLAAGMSSIGAKFLASAGFFPNLSYTTWNMSSILSERSITGQILHAMLGYSEQPMMIQVVFYVGTLVLFLLLMNMIGRKPAAQTAAPAA